MKNVLFNLDGEHYISKVPNNSLDMLFCNLEGVEINDISKFIRSCIIATKITGHCIFIVEPSMVNIFTSSCYPFPYKKYFTNALADNEKRDVYIVVTGIYPVRKEIHLKSFYTYKERITELFQKPSELYKDLINEFSKKGDLIADPYMNRGSFLRNVISLNRNYIGFEENSTNYKLASNEIRKAEIYNHSLSGLSYYPMYATY